MVSLMNKNGTSFVETACQSSTATPLSEIMSDKNLIKVDQIRSFVNKTCNIFDAFVRFNKQIFDKIEELKSLGTTILTDLDQDLETGMEGGQEGMNLAKQKIERLMCLNPLDIESPLHNIHKSINEQSNVLAEMTKSFVTESFLETNGQETLGHEAPMTESVEIIADCGDEAPVLVDSTNQIEPDINCMSNVEMIAEEEPVKLNDKLEIHKLKTPRSISKIEIIKKKTQKARRTKPLIKNALPEINLSVADVKIKDCKIIVNKLELNDLKRTKTTDSESDEDKSIDNLCNLNKLLANLDRIEPEKKENNPVSNEKSVKKSLVKPDLMESDDESIEEIIADSPLALSENINTAESDLENESFSDNQDESIEKIKKKNTTEPTIAGQKKSVSEKPFMPELIMDFESENETEEVVKVKKSVVKAAATELDEIDKKSDNPSYSDDEETEVIYRKRSKKPSEKISSSSASNTDAESNSEVKSEKQVNTKKRKNRLKFKKSDTEGSEKSEASEDDSEPKTSKKRKRTRKSVISDDDSKLSNDDDSVKAVDENETEEESDKTTRHKLRKIIDESKLTEETKNALAAETERKKRIEEKRKLEEDLSVTCVVEKSELYLDIDKTTKKKLIKVDDAITRVLKPHQIEGLQFMWDSCFENVEMIEKGEKGSGCILAHCMGLGKTLQVVSLVHTLLSNKDLTKVNRVLILLPINVLLNWHSEFIKWTANSAYKVKVYELPADRGAQTIKLRLKEIEKWFEKGGVLLMGYTIFSRLAQGQCIKPKKLVAKFQQCLLSPGPDLVICDEGHLLKTEKTNLSKSVYQIETQRRIVLTGTPLQNNLIEYHCMVSFVKPNLLGTRKEFMNRFVNPITNGQHKDSTDADVRYMKKRAHVLHNALDGCVQRKDYDIIRNLLPPKYEYVLLIRLSPKQIDLYQNYLVKNRGIKTIDHLGKVAGTQLFADFQVLSRIWTHPWVLKLNEIRVAKIEQRSMKKFLDDEKSSEEEEEALNDDESDDENDKKSVETNDDMESQPGCSKPAKQLVEDVDSDIELVEVVTSKLANSKKKLRKELSDDDKVNPDLILENNSTQRYSTRATRALSNANKQASNEPIEEPVPEKHIEPLVMQWWSEMVTPECEFDLTFSGKLVIFEQILRLCQEKRDKLIVFSQSLMSLDLIEKFLNHFATTSKQNWKKDVDYFRIDGQIDINKRKKSINMFNDLKNARSRLFLISTRAGGIGINLVGANRCIVFDASWNPSYDTQSIFRIFRFGQLKNVYVYRFLAQGTMEEKIYQRQVAKQSLAQRVIDEHQLDRHFTSEELRELYKFEPDLRDNSGDVPVMPEDDVLKQLLLLNRKWITSYHQHDSLLENKLSEGLSEEERKLAWVEYEAEKERPAMRAIPEGHMESNDDFINNLYTQNMMDPSIMYAGVNPQTNNILLQNQLLYQKRLADEQFLNHYTNLNYKNNRNNFNSTPMFNGNSSAGVTKIAQDGLHQLNQRNSVQFNPKSSSTPFNPNHVPNAYLNNLIDHFYSSSNIEEKKKTLIAISKISPQMYHQLLSNF